MRKRDELTSTTSCLAKAADDEPIFVLRGQDVLAADTVRFWAEHAIETGTPAAKIDEAFALADQMEQWPNRKTPD